MYYNTLCCSGSFVVPTTHLYLEPHGFELFFHWAELVQVLTEGGEADALVGRQGFGGHIDYLAEIYVIDSVYQIRVVTHF